MTEARKEALRDMCMEEVLADHTGTTADLLERVMKLEIQIVILIDAALDSLKAVDPTGTGSSAILRDRLRSLDR